MVNSLNNGKFGLKQNLNVGKRAREKKREKERESLK